MTDHPARARLCIFAREPKLGAVKTRLATSLGAAGALAAYQRLVAHAVSQLRSLHTVRTELWIAGATTHPQVQDWAQALGAAVQAQPPGDLGRRMHAALYDRNQTATSAVVVGTDCPGMTPKLVNQAVAALDGGADVTLVPAEDGGYGLIGMNVARHRALSKSPLADIRWGGSAVYADTLKRCQQLDLEVVTLGSVWDVDTLSDWQRFLAKYGPGGGPGYGTESG